METKALRLKVTETALGGTGLAGGRMVHANLQAAPLMAQALRRGEGTLSASGALVVRTGVHTGRSVQDKFVVDEDDTRDEIWWGKINQKISPQGFNRLVDQVRGYLQGQILFTQDLYAGASPRHRVRVRLVTTNAWHALFARNIFIRPSADELHAFEPDYVILHAPSFSVDPATCGVRSDTAIALSFAQKLIVIAGTEYAGEIKKSIFTVMNYLLPAKGVFPMHCSANIGAKGDAALFFGLSGTGKTTLSSDPQRVLIGDDEHGWGPDGIFNVEGGCYAKVINLREEAEPEIWDASRRFATVLENVVTDGAGTPDYDDNSLTENTRACYPLDAIARAKRDGLGPQPRNVVMLTADAFGVLPPLSRLTPAQAMYHFLSGYTARVAGTEKGLGKEPKAAFSTCFGAPFLPRPPQVYGNMLMRRLAEEKAACWLVNTGWTGGPYGVGHRISIKHTRALLSAAIEGELDDVEFRSDPYFGLSIPVQVQGVPDEILDPSQAWADRDAYERQARYLIGLFEENFRAFADHVPAEVRAAAIGVVLQPASV
jgi:phosphoenolpyruvate carboxykinase (ATP)